MINLKNKRVALVYDRVNKWGGAERVLLALHHLFPEAPLYTSVYNKSSAPWANEFIIKTSFLQNLPFASNKHEFLPLLTPLAFESFSFDDFDLVISVTSEAAKGIITKPHTKHICYCLTPTRYLWSGYKEYFKNPMLKMIGKPAVEYLRGWDMQASTRPDIYIAISNEVKRRIKTYYDSESEVVYPPVSNSKFNLASRQAGIYNSKSKIKYGERFFLVVSRLVPYKRVDIAIMACNELKLPLVIIGKGSEEDKLRRLAGPTIKFLGNVTDEELIASYTSCEALIFPGNEDFGLVMVEAQAAGKPVIAYRSGGALETIIDNKTGIFFDSQNKISLTKALMAFSSKNFLPDDCYQQANKFNIDNFEKQFIGIANHLINELKY